MSKIGKKVSVKDLKVGNWYVEKHNKQESVFRVLSEPYMKSLSHYYALFMEIEYKNGHKMETSLTDAGIAYEGWSKHNDHETFEWLEEKEVPMNPSPQQIFKEIRTECEHREFSKFMEEEYGTARGWKNPLFDNEIANIKKDHPDWYRWLLEKKLISPKMVKREAWVNVYPGSGRKNRFIIGDNHKTKEEAENCKDLNYIKTILLHSWEEPEEEET